MDTPETAGRQLTPYETALLYETFCLSLNIRLVLRLGRPPAFRGEVGPVFRDLGAAADYIKTTFEAHAERLGCVPFAGVLWPKAVAARAPVASPDNRFPDAIGLIADLAALLKADSYPVLVGAKVLERADAFLAQEAGS